MSAGPTRTDHRSDQADTPGKEPYPVDAVRAFGVAFGPSLLLDLFAAGGTLAVLSGWLFRRRRGLARLLRPLVALGAAFPWAYAYFIRP